MARRLPPRNIHHPSAFSSRMSCATAAETAAAAEAVLLGMEIASGTKLPGFHSRWIEIGSAVPFVQQAALAAPTGEAGGFRPYDPNRAGRAASLQADTKPSFKDAAGEVRIVHLQRTCRGAPLHAVLPQPPPALQSKAAAHACAGHQAGCARRDRAAANSELRDHAASRAGQ